MAIVIKEALKISEDLLKKAGVEAALADAEILLAHLLTWPRWRIWANNYNEISNVDYNKFMDLISLRAQRIPLPYITGFKEFYCRDFIVDENVLIPRPETELLVEEAIRLILSKEITTAAEIGIGSGAISISLAMETDVTVYAVDISNKALLTAKKNIDAFDLSDKINVFEGNLLTPLIENNIPPPGIIIANLPYIPSVDIHTLEPEVRDFEPGIALFSGEDGLDAIRELIRQATGYCVPGTVIGLEFGIGQENNIADYLTVNGWTVKKIICDYSGINRHIFAEYTV